MSIPPNVPLPSDVTPADPESGDTPARSERTTRRVVRAELIIAAIALIASCCASIATIVETREGMIQTQAATAQSQLLEKQLGASVWPYLTMTDAFSPHMASLSFSNDGLGPAIVRTFSIDVDGRRIGHLVQLANAVDTASAGRLLTLTDFGVGSVIRPGETRTIFAVDDKNLDRSRADRALHEASVSICYCSLLHDCWLLQSRDTEPKPVERCDQSAKRITS